MRLADDVTAMILTFNEAPNIARTLARLTWVTRILVIDSGSSDETLEIIARHPNADVVTHKFDTFAGQCNFGLSQVSSAWVLSLDADYELSEALVGELDRLEAVAAIAGYRAGFVYRIHGRALRGTLYPPRTVLYRPRLAHYVDEGHGHRVVIAGEVRDLAAPTFHDDRKPLSRWLQSQRGYAVREADHLLGADVSRLRRTDRIRRMGWPAPMLVFVYTLIAKGCLLDGWAGWYYVLQRTLAEILIALEILERRLQGNSGSV